MSDCPEHAPKQKQTSANHSEFMGSRPGETRQDKEPFAPPRDPLQYAAILLQLDTQWLPSNSASDKAYCARKMTR
jgi:hypothetical protein